MTSFSAAVFDHYRHPRNAGQIGDANASGQAENQACGDSMQLFARVETVASSALAARPLAVPLRSRAGSVLTELLADLLLADAAQLEPAAIEEVLGGLPPMKRHAAQLAADATRALVKNYQASTAFLTHFRLAF